MDKNIKWEMRERSKYVRTIKVEDALLSPDFTLCMDCDYYSRCMRGHIIAKCHAKRDNKACYRKYGIIRFYYAKVCCMTFDCVNYRLTDHNMYGKSTEVSAYIKGCLNKINRHFSYIRLTREIINEMIKTFRKHNKIYEDELWLRIL